MSMGTSIAWTDVTWNPTTGCSRVSEGCRHCYIERTPPFRINGRKLGDPVQMHHDRLEAPLHWKKPRRVFVNSLSDLFHNDVPDEFITQVFRTMMNGRARHHVFQLLTKRPERMRDYLRALSDWPHFLYKGTANHIHLGVSVENQPTADERIPILLQTPAAVRWISAEPLLGEMDLRTWLRGFQVVRAGSSVGKIVVEQRPSGLDWIVCGGESGRKSRPCNVAWIRSIVEQCQAAGVPVFTKQLGALIADRNDAGFEGDTETSWPMDTRFEQEPYEEQYQGTLGRVRLHDRKGGDPAEWPEDLRVRQWPT